MSQRLSEHFTLAELTASDYALRHGLPNDPPIELFGNLKLLAAGLERVRLALGAPILVSSGYRSSRVNAGVGSSTISQHLSGLAADFICPAVGDPMAVARAIEANGESIAFDQLILEFGRWVHCSFTGHASRRPRGEVLSIRGAREGYLAGLVAVEETA